MMYIFHPYNFHTHFMKLPCVSVCVYVCEWCAHSGLSYSKNLLNLKLVFSFILVFRFFVFFFLTSVNKF